MKIERSGIEMTGECCIKTEVCTAKAPGPIIAVWGQPGRAQINVCEACLEEQIRLGKWERTLKVEPSGVVMTGECEIQTEVCTAKTPGPITALWVPPGRTQTNVCRACLEEKMRVGEWDVEGARIRSSA